MVDVRGVEGQARLAFSTLAFPGRPLAEVADLARQWGYDGLELRLIDGELIEPTMSAEARQKVLRDATGLPIVAVDTSIRLTDDEPGPLIESFLRLAADWQSPLIRVFGGALPDAPAERRESMARAADVLAQAVPLAERLGVAIGLETHDSFSASATVAELLEMVPSPLVGAVWDSHHPHRMGESPAEIYTNIGTRLLLAQVKDARRDDERPYGWELVLLGEGEVEVREMIALLAQHRFPCVISVEWEKRWHPDIEEPEIALPQHLRLLKEWLAAEASDE